MNTLPTVAILLFTRSASEEGRHKRFVSNRSVGHNTSVAAQLIEHAHGTATRVGVDVVCVDSAQQIGRTFGERLTGAMHQVFAQGYEHVLAIGNDCPQLDEHVLQQAVAALRSGQAVLGPASDGGVYLLGVSRAQFEQTPWLNLPWQTAQLGLALQKQLRLQNLAVELLPTLADVDDEQDLAQVLQQVLPRILRRRLYRLRRLVLTLRSAKAKEAHGVVDAQPQRGPPAY